MRLLLTEAHEVSTTPSFIHFGVPCDVIKIRAVVPVGETMRLAFVGVPNEINMNRNTAVFPINNFYLDNSAGTSPVIWEQMFSALHSIKFEVAVGSALTPIIVFEYYRL